MIASLPMYDLLEVRAHTDGIWSAIAQQLRAVNIDAPSELTRPSGSYLDHWRQVDLLLSQTCGYPLVRDLRSGVDVVGSFCTVVDQPGQPGWYRSVIVCRTDDARSAPGAEGDPFAGFRSGNVLCAANGPDSLSGWISLGSAWGGTRLNIPAVLVTGGHVASLEAVANGRADVASIDSWTFHLLSIHRPDAVAGVKVIARGPLVAVTPLICHAGGPVDELRSALRAVLESGFSDLGPLGIVGFVPQSIADYAPVVQLSADALHAFDSTLMIRLARLEDIEHLGPIDLASNQLFIDLGHPEFETDESIPAEAAEQAIAENRLFAADQFAADGTSVLIGWVLMNRTGDECSIGQISIHPDVAKRGYGSALLDAVIRWARANGETSVVLSTQSDIPWNQPWYERFGFAVVAPVDWTPAMCGVVEEQTEMGFDWNTRVHMRLTLV